ncbi:hypothetical protein XELAEV_18042576mg, partial [Xenopus laevis]
MESPKQVNTLDVQAQVVAESCSSAVGSGSSAAESCSSEANQEAAVRHAESQEGSAADCEEVMESAETACCVAMEVAEEVLREKPNPGAAMAQVGAIYLEERRLLEMALGSQRLKIVFMSNDLEDIENNITRVLAVLQPWKEVCDNQKRFQEMEESELKKLLEDFSFFNEMDSWDTSGHANSNINAVSVAGVSVQSAVSVPGASVSVRENVAGKSSVTEGAGNPPVNSEGAQGRGVVWDGKRLFRQNVSEVGKSQTSRRKNEWVKERDVFGLVSVTEFDLSFKLSQGLNEFWRKYEVCPPPGRCDGLAKEAMHCPPLTPLYDEEGFGGWKVQVKLHMNFHVAKHLPNSIFIGMDRGVCFYPTQPREEFGQGEIVEEGAPTSEVVGSEREVVQLESSVPCSKMVGRAAEKLHKEKDEQRASQPRREEKWRVMGKKASIKKKDTSPKIVVATGNRFVLPEGKSWGDLAEEERLREEEKREKRKA